MSGERIVSDVQHVCSCSSPKSESEELLDHITAIDLMADAERIAALGPRRRRVTLRVRS